MDERDLKKLQGELRELNRRFKDAGVEIDEEMEEKLEDYRGMMAKRSREAWEKMRGKGGRVNDYVQQNPWKAAGIAFGVGVLTGILMKIRRER